MWNKSIKLVSMMQGEEDPEGFAEETENFTEGIPAKFTDATRSDETIAHQAGYTADQNIEILRCNYQGERYLYDEETGEKYEVKRTYQKDKSMNIVLTCERRSGGLWNERNGRSYEATGRCGGIGTDCT